MVRRDHTFTYPPPSADDRVQSASDPDNGAIAYSWNGPYLMSSTWSGEVAGAVTRSYDGNGWLTSRSVNGAHTASFGYDDGLLTAAGALTIARDPATGLVTGTSLGDVTTTMAYNGFGEPESASASFDGTPLYQVSYTRDQLGRITDKVETIQGVTTTGPTATTWPDASKRSTRTRSRTPNTASMTMATAPATAASGAPPPASTTPRTG